MNEADLAPHENDEVTTSAPALSLVLAFPRARRQPQLTDDELIRVRDMLESFEKVAAECPIASRILTR